MEFDKIINEISQHRDNFKGEFVVVVEGSSKKDKRSDDLSIP